MITTETKSLEAPPEPSGLRLAMTLTIAGLISGIAIVGIFEWTLPTITANKARELREAVFKVLPGVSNMQKLVYKDQALRVSSGEESSREPFVYGGYDADGQFIGYAIAGAGPGFQDTIKLLYGYKPAQRRIVGMEVLESRETPGLGDKIYKDAAFQTNFLALAVEPEIVAVKKGTKAAAHEVDAITGATISSKAIVKILNATNREWFSRLPESGTEPPMSLSKEPERAKQ